jgi:cell division protein FtsZ
VHEAAHDEANIIFGTVIDDKMGDAIKVTVIATGFRESRAKEEAARIAAAPKRQVMQRQRLEPTDPPSQQISGGKTDTPFLRKGQSSRAPAFSPDEGSYGPNFTNLKDDLDVPTFLRRQMD